ncbi:glutamic acid-rich protein-like [Pyrus ussuriensis x Pyrus communis]|uniref:Glutamic acid-rich protein-like n=1 Tax=Pyrus ussuriensis x Pyrus communis TaxID=2448454 RepID=A0A5N5HDY5_9ROSA|nr:glutamic acid-rich protein-like [Pyrus ussuriensis x Pyrus communis]
MLDVLVGEWSWLGLLTNGRGTGRIKKDGEGDEEEKQEEVGGGTKRKAYWMWGDGADIVIAENLTPDTNDVGELKMQLKELKVSFTRLAHEIEMSNRNLVKKAEKMSNVVEELRRVVMEKPMEENTKEED